jgi:CRISPR-associated protein Cas1
LGELMRREIPVVLTSGGDRVLGLCQPPSLHGAIRIEQYRRAADPAFALALAINWVETKILNSRRVLQRLASNRDEPDATPALRRLQHLAESCRTAASIDSLRGYEGTAAGTYFEIYGSFYPDGIPFERRSRRPPHNAPNAVLSYAYTLLAAEAESALHAAGLDPAIGLFHEPADRRASLALDLIEPFRAPVADAMAIDLFSHGILSPDAHFRPHNGGIYLSPEGRKRFFVAYERRLERTFTSEQHGRRTSLRQEIHSQAVAIKNAFADGEPFEPFLMN